MARARASDESLVSRMEGCTRTLHFAAQRISKAADEIGALEEYLKKDVTIVTMFRLQLETIRQEIKYLGQMSKEPE
jgi:hypothetical protein